MLNLYKMSSKTFDSRTPAQDFGLSCSQTGINLCESLAEGGAVVFVSEVLSSAHL